MASIRKSPRNPNKWELRYRDNANRQRTLTFPSKADANAFKKELEADLQRGTWVDPALGRMTFGEFVEQSFLATLNGLEPTSRARDLSYLRAQILPVFGNVPIAAIDYSMCQAWVNELATRRAPATAVKAAQIVGKVLRVAVRSKVVPYNAMAEVDLPRIDESEDVFLTPAQVKDLVDAMEEVAPRYRALVVVGCNAGLRIGELAALRWSDIDLVHRTITVARKVVVVTGLGMTEGKTKTKAGRRIIEIGPNVVTELESHLDRFPSNDRVLSSHEGTTIRANNVRRREWAKAVRLAGLDPKPTFHDMRHTAVSLWILAGASDMQIASWAGHTSPQFTKARYGHLFKESGREVAETLDRLMTSATTNPVAEVRALREGRGQ